MANDYFNHVLNRISPGTRALDSQINNIADEIAAGFDKIPSEAELNENRGTYAVDAGAADAYAITVPNTITLTDGTSVLFRAQNANTGASTLDVNGTGVKSLTTPTGSALQAGAIGVDQMVSAVYNASTDAWEVLSVTPISSVAAGGADTQVQVNTGGLLSASADFTWDGTQLALSDSGNLFFEALLGEVNLYSSDAGDPTMADSIEVKYYWLSDEGNQYGFMGYDSSDELRIENNSYESNIALRVTDDAGNTDYGIELAYQAIGIQLDINGFQETILEIDTSGDTFESSYIESSIKFRTSQSNPTNGAGLQIPHGTAPSTPNDGDIWTTTAGLFVRVNGSTVGPLS